MTAPFRFHEPAVSDGSSCSLSGGKLLVAVAPPAWSYGCSFAPDAAFSSGCWLTIRARVERGSASIGILDASNRYFVDQVVLSGNDEASPVSLAVPPAERRGSMVIRSCADEPAALRINILGVRPRSADRESGHVLDGFLTGCEDLLSGAADQDLGPAASVAADLLKRIAPKFGLQAVAPADRPFDAWFADLPDDVLMSLAQSKVVGATAIPSPRWKFDEAVTDPSPLSQLKVALWREYGRRSLDADISLPWLENTTVRMPLRSDLSLSLFTLGSFEPNLIATLSPLVHPGDTFVDVGANEGLYTLLAGRRVGPDGLVIAIEPSPREIKRLRANVAANGLDSRVVVVEQPLADTSRLENFAVAEIDHGGQNAFADLMSEAVGVAQLRPAWVTTLDILAARLPRPIDILKIDVEGAELAVLRGADETIGRCRPICAVEVGRSHDRSDGTIEAAFADADYAVFGIDDEQGCARRVSDARLGGSFDNIVAVPLEKLDLRWPDAPS